MKILIDIGGTYARFALYDGGRAEHIQKYTAAEYESFEAALNTYIEDAGAAHMPLLIATAAYPDAQGLWRFVNDNRWVIDAGALKAKNWQTEIIMNDFEAATWGLLRLEADDLLSVQAGRKDETLPRCLLGPGTGLGLGYMLPTPAGPYVQRTHGGHMPVACVTDEQWFIAQTVQRLDRSIDVLVFEHLVSGPGLMRIYRAVCAAHGRSAPCETAPELLEMHDDFCVADTLQMFHEYLGLFCANAVITGHAYGGLYVTGGVVDRLMEADLFDRETMLGMFRLPGVDSVREALENTPVMTVKTPHLGFMGLIEVSTRGR